MVCHLLSRSIAGLQRRQPSYSNGLITKELANSEKNRNILLPVYFQPHLPTVTIPTFAPNMSICSQSGPEVTASNQTRKMHTDQQNVGSLSLSGSPFQGNLTALESRSF